MEFIYAHLVEDTDSFICINIPTENMCTFSQSNSLLHTHTHTHRHRDARPRPFFLGLTCLSLTYISLILLSFIVLSFTNIMFLLHVDRNYCHNPFPLTSGRKTVR